MSWEFFNINLTVVNWYNKNDIEKIINYIFGNFSNLEWDFYSVKPTINELKKISEWKIYDDFFCLINRKEEVNNLINSSVIYSLSFLNQHREEFQLNFELDENNTNIYIILSLKSEKIESIDSVIANNEKMLSYFFDILQPDLAIFWVELLPIKFGDSLNYDYFPNDIIYIDKKYKYQNNNKPIWNWYIYDWKNIKRLEK